MWSKLTDISIFNYEYTHKEAFWLLLIPPILLVWFILKNQDKDKAFNWSDIHLFDQTKSLFWIAFKYINFGLLLIGLAGIITALATPHAPKDVEEYKQKNIEGIDVVIALDVSGSMLAEDFKPNRLEAAKETALDFIDKRPNDRIGLVVYEGEAYTQVPLTNDHVLLHDMFDQIQTGVVTSGTAIGSGLVTAVNRLRESTAKSKVIILLSDGVNNNGDISPLTAAQLAKEFGIRVYTIGVGKKGMAPYPMQTPLGIIMQQVPVEIDEATLTEISEATNGKYFRATNEKQLDEIYEEIDLLEKSKVKVIDFKVDPPQKFHGILALSILIILISKLISVTWLKNIHE